MALFYQGPRPVLKGRNSTQNINPYSHKVEKYSNWSIFNPSHIWDGAPDTNHVPGTGYFPHDVHMSRVYLGYENAKQPLKNAGGGTRLSYGRYHPWENKSAGNNKVFKSVYGHAPGTPVAPSGQLYWYSNFKFQGLRAPLKSATLGHKIRAYGAAGVPASFGLFIPDDPDPTRKNALTKSGYGKTVPSTHSGSQFGHNKVNQWFGVRKAL